MQKEETFINIPFAKGLTLPFAMMNKNLKNFLKLISFFALISALFSIFMGRGFVCAVGLEGFFCSTNKFLFFVNLFFYFFMITLYISRFWGICVENKSFQDVIYTKIGLKDLKIFGFFCLFLLLVVLIVGGIYALYTREATPNLSLEIGLFVFISLFVLAALFFLLNAVVFARFLDGKKWLVFNKTALPIFDNIYKSITWFLFYLLLFLYLFQLVNQIFKISMRFLPIDLCGFIGDFSLYFVSYFLLSCALLVLKHQEISIFEREKD